MTTRALSLALLAVTALSTGFAAAQDAMTSMDDTREITITIENLTTGQGFSPSFFASRGADGAPIFALGAKASDQLVSVAEGGNIGGFSGMAAGEIGMALGDAVLAIHTLPGQTRTVTIRVDAAHPLIDGVWMLGMTNDGFAGIAGIDGYALQDPLILELRAFDAGSEVNNERKGYLGALGEGNMREPEDGVITWHTGIHGDADAPGEWMFDPEAPVARVTLAPAMAAM